MFVFIRCMGCFLFFFHILVYTVPKILNKYVNGYSNWHTIWEKREKKSRKKPLFCPQEIEFNNSITTNNNRKHDKIVER